VANELVAAWPVDLWITTPLRYELPTTPQALLLLSYINKDFSGKTLKQKTIRTKL
jgi:hypothetical protein